MILCEITDVVIRTKYTDVDTSFLNKFTRDGMRNFMNKPTRDGVSSLRSRRSQS